VRSTYYVATQNPHVHIYKIISCFSYKENIFVLCNEVDLIRFDKHFHSYEIGYPSDTFCILNINEITTLPLRLYTINNGKSYLIFKYI